MMSDRRYGKKALAVVLTVIILIGSLTGCQLAKPDAGEENNGEMKDMLVGVFVTLEYLDLFDQGRLYATEIIEPIYNDETGKQVGQTKKYRFEGVDGMIYISAKVDDGQDAPYWMADSDEGFSDGSTHMNVTDEGEMISLEATVYSVIGKGNADFYINPVYQQPDGKIYAVQGQGMSCNPTLGMNMSQSLNETVTRTEGNRTTSIRMDVALTFEFMYAPEKIVITQINGENQIVSQGSYLPGETPEELVPESDTAYIVVETHTQTGEGMEVTREMYQSGDKELKTFFCREDGICVQRGTWLEWTGE